MTEEIFKKLEVVRVSIVLKIIEILSVQKVTSISLDTPIEVVVMNDDVTKIVKVNRIVVNRDILSVENENERYFYDEIVVNSLIEIYERLTDN